MLNSLNAINLQKMNSTQAITGAGALLASLVARGVEVCFANPGTSEMHFVAALDTVPGIRCVLGLFEGVVTAAAVSRVDQTLHPIDNDPHQH